MPDRPNIRVKFLCRGLAPENASGWLRMFPARNPVWGDCRFIFDPEERHYDWLVVYNDLPSRTCREALACPAQHTLLITSEPSSITTYGSDYLNQFGFVLTGQEEWAISHPGKIHAQPSLKWFYGNAHDGSGSLDYDYMTAHPPVNKERILSTVCAAKAQKHTMHYRRARYIEKLEQVFPELVRFGRGVREINDKAEALDPFRYHIAIENHVCDHWWTEKLSDAFLGMTLPFYYGAPNAADYFPEESIIPINIFDFEGSLHTIRTALDRNEYEKRVSAIREARRLVLEKYNLFATLAELIRERHDAGRQTSISRSVVTRQILRRNPVRAVRIGLEKTAMRRKIRRSRAG